MACKRDIWDRDLSRPKPLTLYRFLLAQLFFQSLRDKFTPKQITKALNRLRHQSSSADDDQKLALLRLVYDGAMERINGQMPGHQELAKHVLSWITCAKRPLTTTELQHAWAVRDSEDELDKDSLPEVEDMISVCAGLVTVDHDGGIIRLVHYTTQEYFEQTLDASFPNVHFEMARTCVAYLSFSTFSSGAKHYPRLQADPLISYAARNWGHHAREAAYVPDEVLDFLQKRNNTAAAYEVLLGYNEMTRALAKLRFHIFGEHRNLKASRGGARGLHLAAYFGLESTTMQLLAAGYGPNMRDEHHYTPLHHAAAEGHVAVVRALLAGKADATATDYHGKTPLRRACEKGHAAVVQALLDSTQVDLGQEAQSDSTALIVAVRKEREAVMQELLDSMTAPVSLSLQ